MAIDLNHFCNINNCKSTTSKQQVELYEIQRNISLGFDDTVDFHTITKNGASQDLVIVHLSNYFGTNNKYKKSIKSRPNESFNVGDLIVWDDNNWIITEVDSDNQIYTKGTIEQCNYILRFQDSTGTIISKPVIFESNSGSLQ